MRKEQWIPIKEKRPEKRKRVLVQYEDGTIDTDKMFPDNTFMYEGIYGPVVAWLPFPEPYKEVKE